MNSLRRKLRYYGRRYIPSIYSKYLSWRNAGTAPGNTDWEDWERRTVDVLSCPDNARIPRIPGAGTISGEWQTMHNGLRVLVDGYYGAGATRLIEANQGSHEPQEELLFDAVVAKLQPGAIMIECGAYWGFYSMCFCKVVLQARAYLIESDLYNLYSGRRNFGRNGFNGIFINAYVGENPGQADDGVAIVAMDEFAVEQGLAAIDILHADIQGAEMQMLRGCEQLLARNAIRFFFVSTHSQELHRECLEFLAKHDYQIAGSVDLEESFSYDGFIVAARPGEEIGDIPTPSKKSSVPAR